MKSLKKQVENVEVNLTNPAVVNDMVGNVSWTYDGARYHIWCVFPSFEPRVGVGDRLPTLYKNPPRGMKRGETGFFNCRHLDATTKVALGMIADAVAIVNRDFLVANAVADRQIKIAEQDAADARRMAEAAILERFGTHGESLLEWLKKARECIAWCRKHHKDVQSGEGIPIEVFIDDVIAKATEGMT